MDKQKKKKTTENSVSKSKEKEPKKDKSKSKDVEISANQKSIKSAKKDKQKDKNEAKQLALDKSISQISMIAPPVELLCEIHKASYAYFCETCEEIICNQCITLGPHNNQYHRIIKMADAYKQRVFIMSQCFRQNLITKRDSLIEHLQKYERQIEEIKSYKHNIEREIRSEYGGFLEKLKLSQGSKSAILLYQISSIQKQINGINDLGTKFYELTNVANIPEGQPPERNICKFLSKSKQLYAAVEYYLNKAVRLPPNIDTYDLPNELQNERVILNNANNMPLINSFRNEVIWNLISKQQIIKKDFETKADYMMRNLSQQADILSNRLRQFNASCVFCGEPMGDNVNSRCAKNNPESIAESSYEISQSRKGNSRHFFVGDASEHLKKTVQT